MPHVVFVSHSSRDADVADAVVAAVESEGIACWIAHRDIAAGPYAGSIVEAIRQARVFVLILTEAAAASDEVRSEVDQAFHRPVSIIEFRAEGVNPPDTLAYYLSPNHRVEWSPPFEAHVPDLVRRIKPMVGGGALPPAPAPRIPKLSMAIKSSRVSCSVICFLALVVLVPPAWLMWLLTARDSENRALREEMGLLAAQDSENRALREEVGRLRGERASDRHTMLALKFLNEGLSDKAASELEEAVARNPDNADAHWLLWRVLEDQGKSDRAKEQMGRALALDRGRESILAPNETPWSLRRGGAWPDLDSEIFGPSEFSFDPGNQGMFGSVYERRSTEFPSYRPRPPSTKFPPYRSPLRFPRIRGR